MVRRYEEMCRRCSNVQCRQADPEKLVSRAWQKTAAAPIVPTIDHAHARHAGDARLATVPSDLRRRRLLSGEL